MNNVDIMMPVTNRFEGLNVLLEILKLNFTSNIRIHVFCKLFDLDKYKNKINLDLIDNFIHIPDKTCSSKETVVKNTNWKNQRKLHN